MIPVYLGRFAPLHLGHQKIIDKLIADYGQENIIIMVGSSNVIDNKTPYSSDFRENLIKQIYPFLKTFQIPDFQDDDKWLEFIKNKEEKLNDEFVFFGGSYEDLKILGRAFKTNVLVDRSIDKISGTLVRKLLKNKDFTGVQKLVDKKIINYLQ